MPKGRRLRGGMPLYKFVGNRILSGFQNRMLGASLSEFHSGYRVYSVAALRKVPFPLNTNDFHFDTEIIIQFMLGGMRIKELPIPTYYGDEICRVNGVKYAWDVTKAVMVARSQQLGLFYDRRFDCAPAATENAQYEPKLDYASPHTAALELVPAGARVLGVIGRCRCNIRSPAERVPRHRCGQVSARAGRGAGRVRPARSQRRTSAAESRRLRLRAAARRHRAPVVSRTLRRAAA
jgi:hypothetical protein